MINAEGIGLIELTPENCTRAINCTRTALVVWGFDLALICGTPGAPGVR
jgi:hypothetical protein